MSVLYDKLADAQQPHYHRHHMLTKCEKDSLTAWWEV